MSDPLGLIASLRRPDTIAIRVVHIFALCFALGFLVLGTFDAIRTVIGDSVHLNVDADFPLTAAPSAGVTGAYDSADLQAHGLNVGTRLLLASGGLLGALTTVAISLAVAWLCQRLLRADAPFTRALTRLTVFCALVLIIVPTVGHLLRDLGTNAAIEQLGLHDPLLIGFGFDALPWAVGIVLAVVGELFRRGERLQRDSDGLI
jgi:hypothetical protein